MNVLRDDRWLVDDEGNLTPEVLQAVQVVDRRRTVRAIMARRVRIPLGLLLFLAVCTLVLVVLVWVRVL